MEKQPSGIDLSRLTQTNDLDEILCPICNVILWEPVGCSECQHFFCTACIDNWLEKSKQDKCPNGCNFVKKKAPPLLFKLLSKLKMKCKNFQNGCEEEINYDSIISHEKECIFCLEQCKGCNKKVLKKDLFNHENECDLILVACDNCGNFFTRKEMKSHEIIKCLQEKINKNEINFKKEISLRDATILKIQEDLKNEITSRDIKMAEIKEKQQQEFKNLNEKLEILLKKMYLEEEEKKEKIQMIKKNSVIKEITLDQYNSWGIGGYMFDVEAKKPLIITQIGFMSRETCKFKVGLYYRLGSFEGKEENPNEWKLLYDDFLSFTKSQVLIIPIDLDLEVKENSRIAFYVACNESADINGEIIALQNNSTPYKEFDDLKIFNGSFHKRKEQRFKLQGTTGYLKNVGFLGKIKYKC